MHVYACVHVCVCLCVQARVCMYHLGASKSDSSFGEAASFLEPPGSPMSGEQIFLTPVLPATLSGHWNNRLPPEPSGQVLRLWGGHSVLFIHHALCG